MIFNPKLQGMTEFERRFIWLFGSPIAASSVFNWVKTIRKLSFTTVLDAGCGNVEYAFYLGRIIDHLKLAFVAEKPPPSRVFEQAEYFS